jgi:hypothetical protein
MNGALGDLLAVEGGAVFRVAESDAFAGVAREPLGDKESGKSFGSTIAVPLCKIDLVDLV